MRDITNSELMNQISYVFQDSKLLKMSIPENVRLGKPDATDEEVMQALKDAQCMDIIDKFKDGVHVYSHMYPVVKHRDFQLPEHFLKMLQF